MTNIAKFDVDDDGGDYGYALTPGQPAVLKLRMDPAVGVQRVMFQVYDPDAFEPSQGIASNPPRASGGAPTVALVGASTGQAVYAPTPTGEVTFPAQTLVHSWIVRCIVNGGYSVGANGRALPDPNLVYERMLYIPAGIVGVRKLVATESTQGSPEGWAAVVNALIDGLVAGGVGGPGPLSVHQELSAAALVDGSGDVEIDPNLGTDITLTLDMTASEGDYEDELASVTLLPLTLTAAQASKVVFKVRMGETPGKTVASWVGFTFADDPPDLSAMAAGETKAISANVDGTANQPLFIASPRVGGFPAP